MHAAHAVQHLDMRQQTRLSPRLQQAVKLLQMSTAEFATALRATLGSNPFLDDAADEALTASGHDRDPIAQNAANEPSSGDPAEADAGPSLVDAYPETPDSPARISARADTAPSASGSEPSRWACAPATLKDHLLAELSAYHLSDRDALMGQYVIDALDEDGYLRTPFNELAGPGVFERAPRPEEWRTALVRVQQLSEPGLAARDLSECLVLQLRALPSTAYTALAMLIASSHLQAIARKDYGGLQRALHASPETVQAACALIRKLDPKPGRRYDGSSAQYVVPDVFVTHHQSRWLVVPNRQACPQPRLHDAYAELFRSTRTLERGALAQELRDARWLIRNVSQRYDTIRRVAESIVERQQRFFTEGDVALRPMMLREVADALRIHESTVSRAAANKYMMTPRGLLEFHHFFSREIATRSGEGCSAAAIRARIKVLIDSEDPASPLSDVCLRERLAADGILVARRTVSKYRSQLKLPAADLRRRE